VTSANGREREYELMQVLSACNSVGNEGGALVLFIGRC